MAKGACLAVPTPPPPVFPCPPTLPHRSAGLADDIQGELAAVGVGPPPPVGAFVRAAGDELVDEVALRAHDLHAVVPATRTSGGGAAPRRGGAAGRGGAGRVEWTRGRAGTRLGWPPGSPLPCIFSPLSPRQLPREHAPCLARERGAARVVVDGAPHLLVRQLPRREETDGGLDRRRGHGERVVSVPLRRVGEKVREGGRGGLSLARF